RWPLRSRTGLTLLELLLVVFILSALALAAATVTDGLDSRFRYDDTAARLANIRRAIIGDDRSTSEQTRLLSGFVADNGKRPGSDDVNQTVTQLLNMPADWLPHGVHAPVFDPDPDVNGYDNGGSTVLLDEPAQTLAKGYRGTYLKTAVGSEAYRDGWNNDWTFSDVDAPNPGDPLTITSLGADGVVGDSGLSDNDADVSIELHPSDWSIPLNSLKIRLANRSGSDWTPSNAVRASILVFENGDSAQGRWRRWTSDDSFAATLGNDDTILLAFDQPEARLPVGEHLIVLVSDPNGTPHDADDILYDNSGSRIVARVRIYPQTLPPEALLTVRAP
ncbi:MAG: type II secretion system protein GspG, partial [Phycisphaeraceae bacterium]|nr:type II secretion system protein GspG [Phycisphaeraceae bacterium]